MSNKEVLEHKKATRSKEKKPSRSFVHLETATPLMSTTVFAEF